MKNMICIVCPKGCHLSVDEKSLKVSGNACERGAEYGVAELTSPVRVITSTVCISGAVHRRCPVKTSIAIPKQLVFDAVRALNGIRITSPVKCGDIIIQNVCNTGADFIATRNL